MSFVPLRQRDLVANQAKLTWTTTKAYLQLDCGPIGPPASEHAPGANDGRAELTRQR